MPPPPPGTSGIPPPGMPGIPPPPPLPRMQPVLLNEEMIKQTYKTKRECFKLIINSQKATGRFTHVELFIDQLESFDYDEFDKIFIQTFFIVELLQIHFKEYKTEWKLFVKKANQWLEKQSVEISIEMKEKLMNLIHSISF